MDYAISSDGQCFLHVIDSNPASYHESSLHVVYYSRRGSTFKAWTSYENVGTDYWLPVSTVLKGGFVATRMLSGENPLGLSTLKKSLKPGRTYTITVPNSTGATFTSSNPTVASVDENGKVTANQAGTCTITVQEDGRKSKVAITVKSVAITLNKTRVSLKAGRTFTLTPSQKGTTGATYRFHSSDKQVATVSKQGKITAKAAGTCTITVTSSFGETATVKVTVK